MNAPVRFAVVGCGHIGKRHAAMIQGHREAELVAVIDSAWKNQSSQVQVETPVWAGNAPAFSSLVDALKEIDVDVIAICTPNGSHIELALQTVEAGCHVLVEKPMGLTASSIAELDAKRRLKGVHVFGVMQNRHAPAAKWLKETHSLNGFGEVMQIHVQCIWNRDNRYYQPGSWRGTLQHDGGPLYTQFSHFLDILLWVFGDIEVKDAHFVNQMHQDTTEFEDGGVIRFELKNGGWGTFTFSTAAPEQNFESSLTVIGSKGSVRIGGQYMDRLDEFVMPGSTKPVLDQAPPPNDYGTYKGSAANHHHVYDNVVDVLLRDAEVFTPIEEGMAVVKVIESAIQLGRR